MATCDLGYDHEDPAPEPEPVVVETAPGTSENDVAIAEINAATEVRLAQEATKREESWNESRVAELEGRVRGMQEVLDRLVPPEPAPEPEPEPVPVPVPVEPEDGTPAPPETKPEKSAGKSGGGWWGSYS